MYVWLHQQNTHLVIIIILATLFGYFIPSSNLDQVFTYNHMALMSLRIRSHVKASIFNGFNESRSFIYTQLYKITSKYYFKIYFNGPNLNLRDLNPGPTTRVSDTYLNMRITSDWLGTIVVL